MRSGGDGVNLIEARKQAHEGWVRSPKTGNWLRLDGAYFYNEDNCRACPLKDVHLDEENWEPKPAPPWEGEVWVHSDGRITEYREPIGDPRDLREVNGWHRIRVREVIE